MSAELVIILCKHLFAVLQGHYLIYVETAAQRCWSQINWHLQSFSWLWDMLQWQEFKCYKNDDDDSIRWYLAMPGQ